MNNFKFIKTSIEGLIHIIPFVNNDLRGTFIKDYSKEIFEDNDIDYNIVEVFYTTSYKGVIRAIHFQREKQQPKLVRCITGEIYDVVVDLRKNSLTFGKWLGFRLSEENHEELLIPKGCGHGYLVMKDSIVSYKCSEKFYDEFNDGIIWNDTELNIHWPLDRVENIILSDKDNNSQTFKDFRKNYKGF